MRSALFALLGLMLLAAPAAASDGKRAAVQATEAGRAFARLAAETAAAGKRIDFTTAPASGYVARIFDANAFAALLPPGATDMPWMLDWFGAARNASFTILYFGADPKQIESFPPDRIQRNLDQYGDQFAAGSAFLLRMYPRMMSTVQAFMATLSDEQRNSPVRQDGLAKMRSGQLEAVLGALVFAAEGGSKPENIRIMMAALRETADSWTGLVVPKDRAQVRTLLATALSKYSDEETAKSLLAVSALFASAG